MNRKRTHKKLLDEVLSLKLHEEVIKQLGQVVHQHEIDHCPGVVQGQGWKVVF